MKYLIRTLLVVHFCFLTLALFQVLGKLERTNFSYFTAVMNDLYFGDWSFGFFSQKVGSVAFERYTLHKWDRSQEILDTQKGFRYFTHAHESYNRFYGLSVYIRQDTTYQDLLSHTVAVRMLNQKREAVKVDVSLLGMQNPSLRDWKAGKRSQPKEVYFAEFAAQ
ncbi:MAG TPA: hypothetical protein PLO56_03185 [Rhodothermales bacterium]|nr:hypothetical protein [Rhodothermales bacterium]